MGSFYDKFLETRGEKTSLDAVEFNTGHLGENIHIPTQLQLNNIVFF